MPLARRGVMTLTELLSDDLVVTGVRDDDVEAVLAQLTAPLVESGNVVGTEAILAALLAREKVLSTGVGHGIAIPHAISEAVSSPMVLLGISPGGVDYRSMDGAPVHVFFVLLSPPDRASHHTRLLARIARLARDPSFVEGLRTAADAHAAIDFIARYERTHG